MTNIKEKYSLVIVGAGPAGLTASIYASRYKVDNLVIGRAVGGLVFEAHKICNFPSEEEITGRDLTEKMKNHAESLGSSILMDQVSRITREVDGFEVSTEMGKSIFAKTVLLSIGTEHRKLNLPGEEKFLGKGISYCATCDAMFYKDKTVAVIGGGNSAHTASLYLSEVAKRVYQIYRGDNMRGETVWIDQLANNDKIEILYNTQVVGIKGENRLEKIVLDTPYKNQKERAHHERNQDAKQLQDRQRQTLLAVWRDVPGVCNGVSPYRGPDQGATSTARADTILPAHNRGRNTGLSSGVCKLSSDNPLDGTPRDRQRGPGRCPGRGVGCRK